LGGPTFEQGGPIFKRIHSPPPSLSSHLSSSPMGVFSRDYSTCSAVLSYQLPSLKHNQLSSQCIGQKRILVRVLYSEIVSMLPHGVHQGKVIVCIYRGTDFPLGCTVVHVPKQHTDNRQPQWKS